MSAWAKIGGKCVCVVPYFMNRYTAAHVDGPPMKRVLTIVNILSDDDGVYLGIWGQPLDEWFSIEGFRPLVPTAKSLEQDAEAFRQIVTHIPAPSKESVE